MLKVLNEEEFKKEVLQSDIPVLVDFYADWCGPCRVVTPLLEKVEGNYEGEVKFVKVNVDENHMAAADYGIRGIPTLMMLYKGTVVGSKVGIVSEGSLTQFITENT